MTPEIPIPTSIGIIMDGNRRWAKAHNLPTFEGHRQGYLKLKEVVEWAHDAQVKVLTVFAFSTENWKRAEEEVKYMLGLIREIILTEMETLIAKNIKVRFIGNLDHFPQDIVEGMKEVERKSAANSGIILAIAASYGGREEIVHAANQLLADGAKEVTMENFSAALYTHDLPDPDLIIRTSGEMRLSGFLPWQAVYSELFFTPTLWPDFSKEEFESILKEFGERERRMGR